MKTDRELIELAAKAANIEVWFPKMNGGRNPDGTRIVIEPCHRIKDGCTRVWDPLNNNCDAFELAVILKIDIVFMSYAVFTSDPTGLAECTVAFDDNRFVATRRAIVISASKIYLNEIKENLL